MNERWIIPPAFKESTKVYESLFSKVNKKRCNALFLGPLLPGDAAAQQVIYREENSQQLMGSVVQAASFTKSFCRSQRAPACFISLNWICALYNNRSKCTTIDLHLPPSVS